MNNNIQEDYCSFEVSKLLKEKGFWVQTYSKCWVKTLDDKIVYNSSSAKCERSEQWIMHPTHALAIKWIRENFSVEIHSKRVYERPFFSNEKLIYNWCAMIDDLNDYGPAYSHSFGNFNTPEEAVEAALLYTLKNLIP